MIRNTALKRPSGKTWTRWTKLATPTACAVIACSLLVGCGSQPADPAPTANPAAAPEPVQTSSGNAGVTTPLASTPAPAPAPTAVADPHAGNIAKIQACFNTESTEVNYRLGDLIYDSSWPTPESTNIQWADFANNFIYDAPGIILSFGLPGFYGQTAIGDCVTFPSDPLYPRIQPGTKRVLFSKISVDGMRNLRPDLVSPDGPGDSERVLTIHLIHNSPPDFSNDMSADKETTTVHMKLFPITFKGVARNTLLIWTE